MPKPLLALEAVHRAPVLGIHLPEPCHVRLDQGRFVVGKGDGFAMLDECPDRGDVAQPQISNSLAEIVLLTVAAAE